MLLPGNGEPVLIHELGQTSGDGEGRDREAWRAAVHGVTKSRTQQGN